MTAVHRAPLTSRGTALTSDDDIDVMIRAAAKRDEPSTADLDRLLRVSATRASHRRGRRWLLAPAAVMAVLMGGLGLTGGLPAIAETVQHLAAQTGIFGDGLGPGGSDSGKHYTEQDKSEWVNLNSSDFVTYAVRLMPSYVVLPAGTNRARFASNVAHILHDGLPTNQEAVMQTTGVRHAFEIGAQCIWYHDWKDAAQSGQSSEAARAAKEYLSSATWPLTVATDGGGVVANNKAIYHAAAGGNWAKADFLRGGDCDSDYMKQLTR